MRGETRPEQLLPGSDYRAWWIALCGHYWGRCGGDRVRGNLHSADGTIPASANNLNLRFIDYFKIDGDKIDGDKIVDHQTIFDQMEMLGQLGALPPT
jgi:hypothetical protein